MGIRCPHCQSRRSRVVDSGRQADDQPYIRRRRMCLQCPKSFFTREYRENPRGLDDRLEQPINRKLLKTRLFNLRKAVDNLESMLKKKGN